MITLKELNDYLKANPHNSTSVWLQHPINRNVSVQEFHELVTSVGEDCEIFRAAALAWARKENKSG